jgi:hypothetical protein
VSVSGTSYPVLSSAREYRHEIYDLVAEVPSAIVLAPREETCLQASIIQDQSVPRIAPLNSNIDAARLSVPEKGSSPKDEMHAKHH